MMTEKKDQRFQDVLIDLGESSSLHAVPKMVSSRQIAVKVLWGILLCGATGLFCYQFIQLLKEFLTYPVKTSVSLKFEQQPFPAITICNVNPFKKSVVEDSLNGELYSEIMKLDYMFQDLSKLWDRIDSSNDTDETWAQLTEEGETQQYTRNEYVEWRSEVLATFAKLPHETRRNFGIKLNDFVKLVTVSGAEYYPEEIFKEISNNIYGNCFTTHMKLTAVTTGQDSGITIVLNLETHEYFEHFTQAYGVKLLIHQRNTFPQPSQDGYILNPGFETNIGLKRRRIKSLGGKYGKCYRDSKYDINGTHYDYTVALCHSLCGADVIERRCNCTPIDAPIFSDKSICSANYLHCVHYERTHFASDIRNCNCHKRCEDDIYSASVSGRSWPVQDYLEKVLMQGMCAENASDIPYYISVCSEIELLKKLSYETYQSVSQNFLKVNIYFEDLVYEDISEEPLYTEIRFVSDIGGTLGLFMGASLLTFVEVLQLILEVVLFLKRKR